jgi:hypothetical protein
MIAVYKLPAAAAVGEPLITAPALSVAPNGRFSVGLFAFVPPSIHWLIFKPGGSDPPMIRQ